MPNPLFFHILDQKNISADGTLIDPSLHRRLQHPTCVECQEQYRKKYPGLPFKIECKGIYSEQDFLELSKERKVPLHDVKEALDRVYWAEKHYKVPDSMGDLRPFKCRNYQEPVLRCTATRKIDRLARGTGKSSLGYIEELHTAYVRKNRTAVVVTPQQHQAESWYDELLRVIEDDPDLAGSLVSRKKKPYGEFKFANGYCLRVFTAGSKSGRGADALRSQTPRRVRLDEQDYLCEADWSAIGPLRRRYPDSEFHGSSTPTGARQRYWQDCTQDPTMKEFYYPIMVHPDWGPQMEEECRREARTEARYQHEYLAEFGDKEQGVFKAKYVDVSRGGYAYGDQVYDSSLQYVLGVDWNGQGTGARLRVLSYNQATHKRRVVDAAVVTESQQAAIDKIFEINRKWHCNGIFVDAGYGGYQVEHMRRTGRDSKHPDDHKVKDLQVIDFGAKLVTNCEQNRLKTIVELRPGRPGSESQRKDDLERPTKPYMVEGAVMVLEQGLFEYSREDTILDEQLRAYSVKTWSSHGYPASYESGGVGDHDLDAVVLALFGIEMMYGIIYEPQRHYTAHQIHSVAGFGVEDPVLSPAEGRTADRIRAGIPSRSPLPVTHTEISRKAARLASLMNGGHFVVPNRPSLDSSPVPSRTALFRGPGQRGSPTTHRWPL